MYYRACSRLVNRGEQKKRSSRNKIPYAPHISIDLPGFYSKSSCFVLKKESARLAAQPALL
jgi:hypothetical protein